jgi:hypothetical protein
VVEAKGWVASALNASWFWGSVAGVDHALMRVAHGVFVCDDKAYVEHGWIAASGVFAMHQDEDKAIFSFEDGEFSGSAALGDFEVEAAFEEFGEAGDV